MIDLGMPDPLRLVASPEATRPTSDFNIHPRNVRFLNVTSESDSVRLSNLNPFIIRKVIDGQAGPVEFVKKLASGDLLIKVVSATQVKDLLKLRMIHDNNVKVSVPRNLNTCRGVISCRDLKFMTEAEIVECMQDQDVVAAKIITRLEENVRVRTNSVILSFAKAKVPEKINVGYERIEVRPYVPNPMRCFKCQKFGHGSMRCKSSKTICGRCTGEHDSKDCKLTPKCVNCSGNHPSFDRDNCDSYKLETEIIAYKVKADVSFYEARKHVVAAAAASSPVPNVTYATRVVNKPTTCNASCQTYFSAPPKQTVSLFLETATTVSTCTSDDSLTDSSQSTTFQPIISLPSSVVIEPITSHDSLTDSSQSTTSQPIISLPSSVVVESTQQHKSDRIDTSNMTVLKKSNIPHIVVPVVQTSHSSLSRSSSTEQLDMETTTTKTARSMSPGQKGGRRYSQSPNKWKKAKHHSKTPPRKK